MAGTIRIGIGGWTFEPWRGVFYPKGLPHRKELEFASRALTSIEINGTYYSAFKPKTWAEWRAQTPDDFVFSVKASRYATNRKQLSDAAQSITRFLEQGLSELGPKLGPINWQFMATKKFDASDFEGFLALLPKKLDGLTLRHALEVRHPSFDTPEFFSLAKKHGAAIVFAAGGGFPALETASAPWTYARIMQASEDYATGLPPRELEKLAATARSWQKNGDVFLYFIAGAKDRNPAAAQALIKALST